ncbi:DUF2789 family protein [Endozoicomonas sp. 8E]|uniref:DUF2789 family protein n=1 Tax=Endozoicomonas sp. 8E TaxID=3035692 RepID=UPI002939470A|nr:DUF2789 family protein [Endozoicomonas sp. 8E]WOG28547.1 DUF2789 family protein [Endozoicomonas sp. 8E]
MEPAHHTMNDLFDQLGLPSSDQEINAFIEEHKQMPRRVKIEQADFFSDSQQAFIQQAYNEDADWVVVIEHLDALLREKPS